VSQETWAAVVLRAGYTCEVCGRHPASNLHHRVIKGMGGTSAEWTDEPWNLLAVCGTGTTGCHHWIHSNRNKAEEYGWIVSRWGGHPGAVPAFVKNSLGHRRWVLLTRDGQYTTTAARTKTTA
jgi:hypothetical protein